MTPAIAVLHLVFALFAIACGCILYVLEVHLSTLADKITGLKSAVDHATEQVQGHVATLKAAADELTTRLAAETPTADELKELDNLKAKIDAIDPMSPVVLPPTTPAPPEPPDAP